MKSLSKTLLAFYLLALLWVVLFKFSSDLLSVVMDHQTRSLNVIPFTNASQGEMISNFVAFIPFGLLLGVTLKRIRFWEKLFYIFTFSLTVEVIQFVLAIGATDVTDVITNTLGGLSGLLLYDGSKRYIDDKKLDQFIVMSGIILLILLLLLRFLVFKVRY